jgi:hypothetical protein
VTAPKGVEVAPLAMVEGGAGLQVELLQVFEERLIVCPKLFSTVTLTV